MAITLVRETLEKCGKIAGKNCKKKFLRLPKRDVAT